MNRAQVEALLGEDAFDEWMYYLVTRAVELRHYSDRLHSLRRAKSPADDEWW